MFKAGDPVDIKLWTKSREIQCWRNCIPLRYNFYQAPSSSSCSTCIRYARPASATSSRSTVFMCTS